MNRRLAVLSVVCIVVVALVPTVGGIAHAQGTGFDDGAGHEWRQLTDTTGVTWNDLAAVCPRDGVSPCTGLAGGRDVTGWVWATADQVVAFMGQYAPDLLSADPSSVGGPDHLFQAMTFLDVMRPTFFFSGYPTTVGFTGGWTSSTDATGAPMFGSAGYEHPIFNGSLGVGPGANPSEPTSSMGAWLWRTAGLDYTPPVITSHITGTLGSNDWYTSDVALTWNVADESPIDSRVGCTPLSLTTDV